MGGLFRFLNLVQSKPKGLDQKLFLNIKTNIMKDMKKDIKDIRVQHIEFIEKDTEKRGERITSEITFFGALYQLFVKKEGDKRAKKVNYSAAENVMNGYRAISPQQ